MERLSDRFCDYRRDQQRLTELVLAYRAARDVRLYPTIWRVRLLLTSRVWEPSENTRIWENASGKIVGFAMVWQRQAGESYIVLESFVHPSFATVELLTTMVQWGDRRVHDIVAEQKKPLTVYANGFSQYASADELLKQSGFSPLPPNPDKHSVYFGRSLRTQIPTPLIPPGYNIRRLRDVDDLESYQSVYGFAKVNPLHRKELLGSDEYRHLVLEDESGEIAAYCECSICRAEWHTTNQHIGWIDYIGTKPDQQKQGFGRAILLAGLIQLQDWGADTAMLITVNTNVSATSLYRRTGFEPVDIPEYPSYTKQIAVAPSS